MKTNIAYCGLTCENCPIHLASREKDEESRMSMRLSIANLYFENYGITLDPNEVNDCDGCKAGTGRLFSGCVNCEIRECASSMGYDNCGLCPDYACNKFDTIFHNDENAKVLLRGIRQMHQV